MVAFLNVEIQSIFFIEFCNPVILDLDINSNSVSAIFQFSINIIRSMLNYTIYLIVKYAIIQC